MKLPEELYNFLFHNPTYKGWQSKQEDFYEAIVRDCAKVAEDYLKGGAPASTMALYLPKAILARYSLTESPTEQLVVERAAWNRVKP